MFVDQVAAMERRRRKAGVHAPPLHYVYPRASLDAAAAARVRELGLPEDRILGDIHCASTGDDSHGRLSHADNAWHISYKVYLAASEWLYRLWLGDELGAARARLSNHYHAPCIFSIQIT
jgi:hypothetical protein